MEDGNKEVTPGGSQVFRHNQFTTDSPPISLGDSSLIEAIQGHVARHFGGDSKVIHESSSPFIHLDIHVVPPSPDRPFYTLITSGMSEHPMKVPAGSQVPERIELVLCLPADWNLNEPLAGGKLNHWALKSLWMIARLPHAVGRWLAEGHTIPDDETGASYDSGTNMCCALLAPSANTPDSFQVLKLSNNTTIRFLGLWFITKEEMEFKLQHGYEALLPRLLRNNCSELLQLDREASLKQPTIPEDLFGNSFASRPARIETRWEDLQRTLRVFINPTLILFAVGSALTGSGIISGKVSSPAPGLVVAGAIALLIAIALGLFTWRIIKNMRIVFRHGLLHPGIVADDSNSLLVASLVNISHSGSQPYYVVVVSSQMLAPNRALSLYKGAKVPVVCSFRRGSSSASAEEMGRWGSVDLEVAQAGNSDPAVIAQLMSQFAAEEWERLLRAMEKIPKPVTAGTYPVSYCDLRGTVPPPLPTPPPLR